MTHETSWSLIHAAAGGAKSARSEFSHRYLPVVRRYLETRWKDRPSLLTHCDDAVQEVFLDCFKSQGALQRADADAPQGFRAFLYGITRNVALHFETRAAREAERRTPGSFHPELTPHQEAGLSTVFDRCYAQSIVDEAGTLHEARARAEGGAAWRRFELLRLRFFESMPIREIATLWSDDPVHVHREYAQARREFRRALCDVVAAHERKGPGEVEPECRRLLTMLA